MKKLTFLMLFAVMGMMAEAQISRYIKVIGTGDSTGTSWSNASGRTQIQARIDEVALNANKGTVYFATGTYYLGATITIKDGVNCFGGYSSDGNTRDLMLYQSILDGQDTRRVLTIDGGDNALFAKSTIIDGFVIQRGKDNYGAAASIGFRILLRNCIIRNNRESSTGGGYGTIFMKSTNTSAAFNGCLANCLIINNTSSRGIIFTAGITSNNKTFSLVNCVIANNKINAMGTFSKAFNSNGITIGDYAHYTQIVNNIFWNNTGPSYSLPLRISNGTLGDVRNNIIEKQRDSISNNINATLTNYYSAPTFANSTSYVGHATNSTQTTELNNSDWRLKSGSQGINIGYSGQLKDRVTMSGTTEVLRNYTDYLSTDIMGNSRFISTTPEIGSYEYDPITSTVSSSNNDHGTVNANQEVSKGSLITQTATPSSGYHFVNWTESSSEVSTNATYSFTASTNRTFVANFEPNTVPVSSGTINASTITCTTCDVTVAAGAELTVGATKELKSVTVAAGGKLTITAGNLNVTNGITLESTSDGTATLVDAYETPTVNATVKQYVTAGRNWYMSAPLNNTANVSDLNKGNSVQYYEESTGLWKIASGTLTRGRGYIQVANSTQGTTGTVQFEGIVNSGDVPVTLTNNTAGRGFNLVGNPYPSYLNWSLVATDLVNTHPTTGAKMPNSTMWYRTIDYNGNSAWATGYLYAANSVVYNGTSFYKTLTGGTSGATAPTGTGTNISDGSVIWQNEGSVYVFATVSSNGTPSNASLGSNLIPPMQAFWVKSNGGTLTFKNSMRAHEGSSNKLKAPKSEASTMPLVRLSVSNGASADQVAIYASENASNDFDSADAPKFFNNSGSYQAEIYTLAGNEKLAINALNNIEEGTTLALGFVTEKDNRFSLKATEIANLPANLQLILRDKQTNTEFNLSKGEVYQFGSSATNNADRFSLIFRAKGTTTGFDNKNQSQAIVYTNATGQIVISAPEKINYAIYNAVGQLIENGVLNTERETRNTKHLAAGVYVVKVNNQSTRVVVK